MTTERKEQSMKLKDTLKGTTVLLPIKVMNKEWGDWDSDTILVELDEGPGGKSLMRLHPETVIYPCSEPRDAPIEVDDLVFVAFEDGKWQVADIYQDQLFLTPHMDMAEALSGYPRKAMVADVVDCYHVTPSTEKGRR